MFVFNVNRIGQLVTPWLFMSYNRKGILTSILNFEFYSKPEYAWGFYRKHILIFCG